MTVASTLGLKAVSDATAYCASKFGVVGFTRALAAETAGPRRRHAAHPRAACSTHFFDGRPDQYKPGAGRAPRRPGRGRPGRRLRPRPARRRRAARDRHGRRHGAVLAVRLVVLRALGLGDLLTAVPALRALAPRLPRSRARPARPGRARAARARWRATRFTRGRHRGAARCRRAAGGRAARPDVAVNLHGRGPQSTDLLRGLAPRRLIAFGIQARWDDGEHETAPLVPPARERGHPRRPRRPRHRRAAGPAAAPRRDRHPPRRVGARAALAGRALGCGRARRARAAGGRHRPGRGEEPLAATVAAATPAPRCSPATGLGALAALVAGARRVLCADTGVAHLATALGTPSVVLFGPTSPARWGPPRGPAAPPRAVGRPHAATRTATRPTRACSPCIPDTSWRRSRDSASLLDRDPWRLPAGALAMSAVLGVNAVFHDPAAALVVDGRIVAAAEEERFSRRKHGKSPVPFSTWELPEQAIALVPASAAACARPTSTRSPTPTTRRSRRRPTTSRPTSGRACARSTSSARRVSSPRSASTRRRVRFVAHHVAHAASAHLCAGAPSSAVLVVDGRGERASHLAGHARADGSLEVLAAQRLPHSLGLLYEELTDAPRLPPLVGRVQGHGDGVLRDARATSTRSANSSAPPATAASPSRRSTGRRSRRAPTAGTGRDAHADLACSVQRAPRGGAPRARALAARADRRGDADDGRRRGAQLRRELADLARGPVRRGVGAARVRRQRHGAGRRPARRPRPRRPVAPMARRRPRPRRGTTTRSRRGCARRASPTSARADIADAVAETLADDGVVAWFQGASEYGPRALGRRIAPGRPAPRGEPRAPQRRQGPRAVPPGRADGPRAARGGDLRRPAAEPVHAVHPRRATRRGGSGSRPSSTSTAPRGSRPSARPATRSSRRCSPPSSAAPASRSSSTRR